ncbi:MAG TPA: TetM/TetW/TetO/TetS family tetracycline resistance ribosomal protection protein [Clostridiales bacterium]|nr:TetM/TetW/TetO/TetS family tetracycline resistance ribosomal protection protein [Clostridiales bacterium]
MKKIVLGVVAHVDAGKTTLSEAMLYLTGKVKKLGRVDHQNAYFDTHALERGRGITIFAKQAVFQRGDTEITLIDTPGHVDFAGETERALQILDYALLVISGGDGVEAHTETLWRLLRRYEIPTFLFVTKTDQPGFHRGARMREIKRRLDDRCVAFDGEPKEEILENIALSDERLLESYLKNGTIPREVIGASIAAGRIFPCYFGSGLKLEGVETLLDAIDGYTVGKIYPEDFGAKIYKIARDGQGNRLTHLKITGGALTVRTPVTYTYEGKENGECTEKIHQIRLYSGEKYETAEAVSAGSVCAVLGLSQTRGGMGLGFEKAAQKPILEPVLSYRLLLPEDCDGREFLPKLRLLEEEEPLLRVVWNETLGEIYLQLMGAVQIQILTELIEERFGAAVRVSEGRVMYKETIAAPVVGMGHFEPLRHYAEVHLLLKPGKRGSGLVFASDCDEALLDGNSQRLILQQLKSGDHPGVLCGAPLTDLKITLIAGRAHLKHTVGGDFREAAFRALRQGLMQAESILLEPYYRFSLTVPSEQVGRAINDIQGMHGVFSAPYEEQGLMTVEGTAPAAAMNHYFSEVISYTRGKGRLHCVAEGYMPCHNPAEVMESVAYDAESDREHPADSVFYIKGGGTVVKWDQVQEYMHVDNGVRREGQGLSLPDPQVFAGNFNLDEKELNAIMEREFGPIKRPSYRQGSTAHRETTEGAVLKKDYLIVDGYNMIFAWEGLKELAVKDLAAARHQLIELLGNYRGYVRNELVLVFDGYKIKGNLGERFDVHGIHVVYTKEGQTGDMYIEKLLREIGRNYAVRVASSDALIQLSAVGSGVLRVSALELKAEIDLVDEKIKGEMVRLTQQNQSELSQGKKMKGR